MRLRRLAHREHGVHHRADAPVGEEREHVPREEPRGEDLLFERAVAELRAHEGEPLAEHEPEVELGAAAGHEPDDGEPAGTAGKPILEAIISRRLTNVVVVVTRYFGGVLLGAPGLVRAYSRAAHEGLEAAKLATVATYVRLRLVLPYELLGRVLAQIEGFGARLVSSEYAERARLLAQIGY